MTIALSDLYNLFNTSQYNKAIILAEQSYSSLYTDPSVAKVVAACYFKIGDFAKSLELQDEIASYYKDDADFLSLYAATCRRMGLLEKSRSLFVSALSFNESSIHIKNNYANLLIDLSEFDKAQVLLDGILSVVPDFEDAIQNLNRLKHLKSVQFNSNKSSLVGTADECKLGDPLLLAFGDEEVKRSSKRYQLSPLAKHDLPVPSQQNSSYDQIKLAQKMCDDGEFDFALKLCSRALSISGPQGFIYDTASDIYLHLKKFMQAEACLLHALAIDGPSSKRYLNLVSLSSMKGDNKSAYVYLEKAASIDPSHPQLSKISESLESPSQASEYMLLVDWIYPEVN